MSPFLFLEVMIIPPRTPTHPPDKKPAREPRRSEPKARPEQSAVPPHSPAGKRGSPPRKPPPNILQRGMLRLMTVFFLLFVLLISVNLFRLSFNEKNAQAAQDLWTYDGPLLAARGDILDRNGRKLASSIMTDTLVAAPPLFADEDISLVAEELAPILDMDKAVIMERLSSPKQQINLKRLVEPEVSKQVMELGYTGINAFKEPKRYYQLGNFASSLLGITGMDNNGIAGIENEYNEQLSGINGQLSKMVAVGGQTIPDTPYFQELANDGYNIVLTIDEKIQYMLEQKLEAYCILNEAEAYSALIMDVHTGEILAAGTYPAFDPNDFLSDPDAFIERDGEKLRNKLFHDAFEPGSTFKLITALAALHEGLVHEEELIDDSGLLIVDGAQFRNWNFGGAGLVPFKDSMRNSSNVVLGQIGQRLGPELLYSYHILMGFGQKTGIDFPDESAGILFEPEEMGPTELVTAAFGQGPAVTPIQQINAIAAIANGGKLMQPMLVRELRNQAGQTIETVEPTVLREVASPETMARMRTLMEYIINAPGSNGASSEYRLAGKTGTADKFNPETGTYFADKYIASTIGFAPADQPQYAIYVYADDPKGPNGFYGGQVAAPLFREIAEELLRMSDVMPQLDGSESLLPEDIYARRMPRLLDLSTEDAASEAQQLSLSLQIKGEGEQILAQYPEAESMVIPGQTVSIYMGSRESHAEGQVIVPDFLHKTMKEVASVARQLGIVINYEGQSGTVAEQNPQPGATISKGVPLLIKLK